MGFWDWFLRVLTQEPGPREPSAAERASGRRGGVAVMEKSDAGGESADSSDTARQEFDGDRWWSPEGVTQTTPVPVRWIELTTEARALEKRLVSHFDGHDLQMPPMPAVAERALRRLRDRKASLADVAEEISEDQVLAAEVLRLANSALYQGLYKATTLSAAVTRLGVNALRTLLLHQSVKATMFDKSMGDRSRAARVWEKSLASAYVMRALAPLSDIDEEDAFLIGLMHDIGNVIVLRIAHEQRKVDHLEVDDETFEYLCFETHQEFGELVADAWQLPDAVKSLIADHHRDPAADDELAKERWMIQLSDMILQMLGFGQGQDYDLLRAAPTIALGLVDDVRFERFLAALPAQVDEAIEAFS